MKNRNAVVLQSLFQADEEMQTAIAAFRRAGKMHWKEFLRPANTDPEFEGGEEKHIGVGLTAILTADRHVATATAGLESLGSEDGGLRQSIRRLDTTFRTLFGDLRSEPCPRRVMSHLKRARRAIPTAVHKTSMES